MSTLDLIVRDPNDLNNHLEVQFEDVIGEPHGIRSHEYVWYNSYQFFSFCKSCCYTIVTVCCGLCVAMECGINLAALTCRHVWCFLPCLRDFAITCGSLERCIGNLVNCCVEPPCSACGWFYSRIHVEGDLNI